MPVIERLSSAFSDTSMPKIYRDRGLNKGSLLLWDPSDTYCRNGIPAGNLSTSAIFKNLADGGADLTVTSNSNPAVLNAGAGGVTFPGVAANGQQISGGAGYDLSALDHDFLAILWAKIPTGAGAAGSAFASMFALSPSSQNGMFIINNGVGQIAPTAIANQQSNVPVAATVTGFTLDVPHQIAVGFRVASGVPRGLVFLDGALVNTFSPTADLVSQSGASVLIGNPRAKSTLYRASLEDTTVSGLTIEDQVLADWNANRLRFS